MQLEVAICDHYFEIRGQGEPLLLLHGGLGNRKIVCQEIGDDLAKLLAALGYRQVDVMGYSFGGAIALRLAIQHPDQVRRLVLVSAGFAQDGFFPELLPMQAAVGAAMAEQMKGTPMHESYMTLAPDPAEFPKLLDAMGEWMRTPYNWADEVRTLKGPVLLVYGDSDMFRPAHIVEFYHLLGGGLKDAGWQREHMSQNRLAILPDVTHYEMAAAPALVPAVLPFLNGKTGPK